MLKRKNWDLVSKAHPHSAFISQGKEGPKEIKSQKNNSQKSIAGEWNKWGKPKGQATESRWWRWKESTGGKVGNIGTWAALQLQEPSSSYLHWHSFGDNFFFVGRNNKAVNLPILDCISPNYQAERIYYASMHVICKHHFRNKLKYFYNVANIRSHKNDTSLKQRTLIICSTYWALLNNTGRG